MPQFEIIHPEIVERICEAPPNKRAKLIDRLIGFELKKKERTKRLDFDRNGKWSKDYIVKVLKDVLADHGKLTLPLLEKLRQEDPKNYPAPSTVRYRFGSWDKAKKAVGVCLIHENLLGRSKEDDASYFLTLYLHYGVKTREIYYDARRKYPQLTPPYRRLLEIFGSFTKFKRVATLSSPGGHLNRLKLLVDSLDGRWPKRSLCKENNIDILFLDEKMGGRKELKALIRDLRSANKIRDLEIEKQKRDIRKS